MEKITLNAFCIAAVLCVVSAFSVDDNVLKEKNAITKCNETNPISGANILTTFISYIYDNKIKELHAISNEQKCNLYCVLNQLKYFSDDGKLNVPGVFSHYIQADPVLKKYSGVFAANLYQTSRVIDGMEDKCKRAFIAYNVMISTTLQLNAANDLETDQSFTQMVSNAYSNTATLSEDFKTKISSYFTSRQKPNFSGAV